MLKFFSKKGMIIEIIHEINSFKQSKWLKKLMNLYTQKRSKAKNEFQKDFYKVLNLAFYDKAMENVTNRIQIEIIKEDYDDQILKMQSKLTYIGIDKSYDNYDSSTFKQNENLIDKPKYLGFIVLELSKLLMYGT